MPSRMAKQISFLQDNSYLIQHNQFSSTLSELPLNRKAWASFLKREAWGHLGNFLDFVSGPGTALFGLRFCGVPHLDHQSLETMTEASIFQALIFLFHLLSRQTVLLHTAKEKNAVWYLWKHTLLKRTKKCRKKQNQQTHAFLLPIILDN